VKVKNELLYFCKIAGDGKVSGRSMESLNHQFLFSAENQSQQLWQLGRQPAAVATAAAADSWDRKKLQLSVVVTMAAKALATKSIASSNNNFSCQWRP
jgi:hypothetical protein